jgi:hypothetical protein
MKKVGRIGDKRLKIGVGEVPDVLNLNRKELEGFINQYV